MNIAHARLTAQHIDSPHSANPTEVVRWMGAIQAQDYGQALWAIGLRTNKATRTTVEKAIADGHILRTWPMRGTIHFVPAEDARWMVNLTGPKFIAADGRRMSQLELTEATIDRCAQLLHDALHDKAPMARPEIMKLLQEHGIRTDGQRGYHILVRLALAGLICIGPMEGKQQTFAWLDTWAPGQRKLERDEALVELLRRYLRSHGPATIADFATWSSQNLTDSKRALHELQSELTCYQNDGREYWLPRSNSGEAAQGTVHLLPGFDEYLLGYKDRRDILHADHAAKIVPGGNGVFRPMIASDGQIIGTWKRTLKPKAIHVDLEPFVSLNPAEHKTIEAELQRYSEFMNLPLA